MPAAGATMRLMRRSYLLAVLAGFVLLGATAALPNVRLGDSANRGDTLLYQDYGEELLHGRIPYRDFFDEYPPGSLPAFVAPAAAVGGDYTLRSKVLQWLLAAACIALTAAAIVLAGGRGWAPFRASAIGFAPVLLGQVTFTRFDFWPAALTAAAIVTLLGGRFRTAFGVLAVAVAAKEYPVVLLPLFVLYVASRRGRRETVICTGVFAAVLGAIVLPFAAIGPGGVAYSLYIQFRRPLQIETLGGSLLLVVHRLGGYVPHVVSTYGSQNLSGTAASVLAALTTLLEIAALCAVWLLYARGRRTEQALLVACAASILAFAAFGKVLSPQYLIWLVPLVPLLGGRAWRIGGVLLALALGLTQIWSQSRYHEVVAGQSIVWVVLARDLVLAGVFAVALAAVYRGGRQTSNPSTVTSR
jgi:Glycosyltransferase family 87